LKSGGRIGGGRLATGGGVAEGTKPRPLAAADAVLPFCLPVLDLGKWRSSCRVVGKCSGERIARGGISVVCATFSAWGQRSTRRIIIAMAPNTPPGSLFVCVSRGRTRGAVTLIRTMRVSFPGIVIRDAVTLRSA